MLYRIVLILIILANCGVSGARPITVSTQVLDEENVPIAGALVRVSTDDSPWVPHIARTDPDGIAVISLDVTDKPLLVLRAFVSDFPPEGADHAEFVEVVADRATRRLFDPLGYRATLLLTDDSVSIVASAVTAEIRTGALAGNDAAVAGSVILYRSGMPLIAPVIDSAFSLPMPMGLWSFLHFDLDNMIFNFSVPPLVAEISLPVFQIIVPDERGGIAGAVSGMAAVPDGVFLIYLVRTDGAVMTPILVRENGLFDAPDQSGSADPAVPSHDQVLLPGDYYVIQGRAVGGTPISVLSLLTAIRTDTAFVARGALNRVTVSHGNRTIVEWNVASISDSTTDLVRGVLFAP